MRPKLEISDGSTETTLLLPAFNYFLRRIAIFIFCV